MTTKVTLEVEGEQKIVKDFYTWDYLEGVYLGYDVLFNTMWDFGKEQIVFNYGEETASATSFFFLSEMELKEIWRQEDRYLHEGC